MLLTTGFSCTQPFAAVDASLYSDACAVWVRRVTQRDSYDVNDSTATQLSRCCLAELPVGAD